MLSLVIPLFAAEGDGLRKPRKGAERPGGALQLTTGDPYAGLLSAEVVLGAVPEDLSSQFF